MENITYDSETKIKATLESDVLQPNDFGVRCLSFYWSMIQTRNYKLEVYIKSMSKFLIYSHAHFHCVTVSTDYYIYLLCVAGAALRPHPQSAMTAVTAIATVLITTFRNIFVATFTKSMFWLPTNEGASRGRGSDSMVVTVREAHKRTLGNYYKQLYTRVSVWNWFTTF